jgi:hypothetical protein
MVGGVGWWVASGSWTAGGVRHPSDTGPTSVGSLEVALGVKEEGAKKFGSISVCKSNRQGLREGEWVLL